MDEYYKPLDLEEYFSKKKCPVNVGDRFYVNNYEVRIGRHPPIYNEVIKVIDSQTPGVFYIEAYRPQCTVGTHQTYSSTYFKNPDVVVERRGIDF